MKYRARPHTIFREIDGRIIALNLTTGEYFTMNEVGTVIWRLLMEDRSTIAILDTITREFAVPADRLNEDLDSFLKELQESDLIEEY